MTDNRARRANVLSIAENMQRNKKRRVQNSKTSKAIVSVASPVAEKKSDEIAYSGGESEVRHMGDPRLFSAKQLEQIGIVHPKSKNRALVDSLRTLRTKLFQLKPSGNFTVLVTSVVPEGGASFIALNLAATISFDKAKTALLIDGNVQDPVLHRILSLINLKPRYGLTDYLADSRIGLENIVTPSGIPRMRIIPVGNLEGSDSEYVTSKKMSGFISDVKQRYDNRFIVIDAPCIATSADARVLADLCDFIVLVAPYGAVTPSQIDAIVDEIDEKKLAGIVLNDEPLANA
jgi:Mrp family chromosome partitioning ATPase